MVELARGLHVIDGMESENVVAIIENSGTVSLVDCGDPGSGERILAYLERNVPNFMGIRTLILTHFDGDHVGAAAELKLRTGCSVVAPEFDAQVIEGKQMTREELQSLLPTYDSAEIDALHQKINDQNVPAVSADRLLRGGERLEIAGGAEVIRVPGHTPGHIVLLLPRVSALITGDTLSAPNGIVGPPNPQYTPSPAQATQSLKRLSGLNFEILVPYHWPPITHGGSAAVRRYVDTLS